MRTRTTRNRAGLGSRFVRGQCSSDRCDDYRECHMQRFTLHPLPPLGLFSDCKPKGHYFPAGKDPDCSPNSYRVGIGSGVRCTLETRAVSLHILRIDISLRFKHRLGAAPCRVNKIQARSQNRLSSVDCMSLDHALRNVRPCLIGISKNLLLMVLRLTLPS